MIAVKAHIHKTGRPREAGLEKGSTKKTPGGSVRGFRFFCRLLLSPNFYVLPFFVEANVFLRIIFVFLTLH